MLTFPLGLCSLRSHFQSLWIPLEPSAKIPTPEFVYRSRTTCFATHRKKLKPYFFKTLENKNNFLRKLIAQTFVEESAVSAKVAWLHWAGSKISANCQGFGLISTPFLRKNQKSKLLNMARKPKTVNCYSQLREKLEFQQMKFTPLLSKIQNRN